jgi:hypothetical protein
MAERKHVLLRLDPDVYEAIARWAADDLRSVNAQIEYALRRALRGAGRLRRAAAEDDERPAGEASSAGDASLGGAVDDDGPGDGGGDGGLGSGGT